MSDLIFVGIVANAGMSDPRMSPAISSTAAIRTRAAQQSAGSPRGHTIPIRELRPSLRQVRLNITQRYYALHEYARIYHALAARAAKGSEHKLILLCLAQEADVRVEHVEMSLRKFRIAHRLPTETWFRRLIRWFLMRWRISWTLARLDRMELPRSRAMFQPLRQLSRLCRVIAAARMRPNQFSTRLSSHHPDDP
jgi:hypothetical protein